MAIRRTPPYGQEQARNPLANQERFDDLKEMRQGDDPVFQEIGPIPGRSGETPRERAGDPSMDGGGGPTLRSPGGAGASPTKPKEPTSMSGSTFSPSPGGVTPFTPLPGVGATRLAMPGKGLFGGQRGLTGGGLGVPLDPLSDEASDPITTLLSLLQGR